MPRSKIQMSLIGNAGARAKAFARRKAGLLKKAEQLAKLCDVDVALIVCGPDGGGGGGAPAPPVLWESDPAGGVIDRYRRLPAEKRAAHTHLGYIDGQLSKEEGRLGKKRRQGLAAALACPAEAALEGMDLEALLASIDAALLATEERRKELGIADDDDGGGQKQLGRQVSPDAAAVAPVVGQAGPPPCVGGGDELGLDDIQAWVDELMWDPEEPLPLDASMTTTAQPAPAGGVVQCINAGNGVDIGSNDSNHQCQAQMLPPAGNGENGHGQLTWHAYQYQPNTAVSFPDHGFQCSDNSICYVDSEMLMPSNANANAGYGGWYDQASWSTVTDESSCDSAAIAGNPAHMPPQHEEHHSMGIGSFVMDADAGGHAARAPQHGSADYYFQCPEQFGAEPEPLQYLSDMAQGISYFDDLQLQASGGCGSGRAQFFAQSGSFAGTPQFISGPEMSQSAVGYHQYQDPGVQHFWMMQGPPGSTDVATASAIARARGGETWDNSGGHYQPWISVYQ